MSGRRKNQSAASGSILQTSVMDIDDIIAALAVENERAVDDPDEIAAMRRRHLQLGMLAQEIALAGLLELKAKAAAGELTAEECAELRDLELELEKRTARSGKPH